jgi:hypothetical protein
MKNIHVLPTDRPSRLIYNDANQLCYHSNKSYKNDRKWMHRKKFNIYITSDEEIKANVYALINGVLCKTEIREGKIVSRQLIGGGTMDICKSEYFEIILTTDQDLIKDGVQAIDDEFLEWFVKNPTYEWIDFELINDIEHWYKIIIPKEEPKQETLEEFAEKLARAFDNDNYKALMDLVIEGAKWQQRQLHYQDVAEDNITHEHTNNEITLEDVFNDEKKKSLKKFIDKHKQETLEDDKLQSLVVEWHQRQLHYQDVAEDNITHEHTNRKFTYKAMATRDCWKELLTLLNETKNG